MSETIHPSARTGEVRPPPRPNVHVALDAARKAAATYFGEKLGKSVKPTDVVVSDVKAHVFTDTSLGIPDPSQPVCSATLPGWIIQVEYQDEKATYHVTQDGRHAKRKLEESELPKAPSGFIDDWG